MTNRISGGEVSNSFILAWRGRKAERVKSRSLPKYQEHAKTENTQQELLDKSSSLMGDEKSG